MKKVIQVLAVLMLMVLTAAVTFSVTYQELGNQGGLQLFQSGGKSKTEEKTGEISAYLDRYFIDEYDDETLADAAAAAMIEATGDPWSYYVTAEDYQSYAESAANAYVGIGITIQMDPEQSVYTVTSVTEGGPAADGDIQVGDVLLSVDGQEISEMDIDQVKKLVRGDEGTQVTLGLRRGETEFTQTLTRASIQETVSTLTMLDGDIALIRIKNFDGDCASQTLSCITQAVAGGTKGIVFDVRFNPGGFKTELVQVLDALLPEGVLFRSKDYAGREEVETSDAQCVELPMAVLVNEDTYSAAEFFAAAMQEYSAAVIVGTQTTGKGNFQSMFTLSDGSAINISIGKYFTPEGKSLTQTGVTPDEAVDLDEEQYAALYYGQLSQQDDAQLQKALDAVKSQN